MPYSRRACCALSAAVAGLIFAGIPLSLAGVEAIGRDLGREHSRSHRETTLPAPPTQASSGVSSAGAVSSAQSSGEAKKPSLSLKITPPVGFAPLKTRLVVDVRNGDDDYEDFYCPTIEWDWGDGTVSANSEDCDPYEAGKSAIKRRFTTEHTFRQPGAFRVAFRLKQKDRVVGTSTVNVQVRTGLSQF